MAGTNFHTWSDPLPGEPHATWQEIISHLVRSTSRGAPRHLAGNNFHTWSDPLPGEPHATWQEIFFTPGQIHFPGSPTPHGKKYFSHLVRSTSRGAPRYKAGNNFSHLVRSTSRRAPRHMAGVTISGHSFRRHHSKWADVSQLLPHKKDK